MNQPDKTFQTPMIETQVSTSKDGRYIIHKTIITDIKPAKFWGKVVENAEAKENAVIVAAQQLSQQNQEFVSGETIKVEEEKF